MWSRYRRTGGLTLAVANLRARGFSLVEVLIALALGTWLVSSVGLMAQRLWLMARLSGDEVELAERGDFALRHLSQALLSASPIANAGVHLSPCGVFHPGRQSAYEVKGGVGIRVVLQGQFPCLPSKNLLKNSPLLVVEQTRSGLETRCEESAPSSNWREGTAPDSALLASGVAVTPTRLRMVAGDCSTVIPSKSFESRRLYYLRDFAWDEGDGFGALMMKTWKPQRGDFGRAEMLVPGVINWIIEPVKFPVRSSSGENRQLVSGVNISLVMRGLRSGFSGRVSPQLGFPALSKGSSEGMTLTALVLSRNLGAPELYERLR
ncbi:MAG: prepilin-type N-terminal cleavage/methylation domain-containing protein [Luminiphilus sp.]|nr:prepilin-type N-terminal cleavage/methylation domain-containing protein [Porticoccaceae bacterium]MDG1460632.1 prepilin-type N-terminal cleavage/methylation domain-containing protein [Luminiphilus sp.]